MSHGNAAHATESGHPPGASQPETAMQPQAQAAPGGHDKPAHDTPSAQAATGPQTAAGPQSTAPKPAGQSEFAREAKVAWARGKQGMGKLLLEQEPVSEVSLLKTPFYIIRDLVRGSIGNVYRRTKEVVEPARDALLSAWNTVSNPITSPVKTLFHPGTYLSNIPRTATATVRAVKNLFKAPLAAANEGYHGLVDAPVQRVNYKVAELPPKSVTGIMAKVSNKVASVLGWPLRAADGAIKWGTDWIDGIDGYFAATQNG